MEPSRSSAHRGRTRMPVDIASGEPASTAWRKPTSAPSGCTSAQAKGWSSGCFGRGSRTQAQVSTVPPGPDLDELGEVLAGERVVLGRRHQHPPVGALDPQQHLLAQAGEEGPDHRTGGAGERVLDDEGRGEHARVVGHGVLGAG